MAKILLIDDDEGLLQGTERLLRAHEHDVTTATNGTQGQQLLQQGRFDLVISDYQMPGMSGLRLLQWLREGGNRVPFILVSGADGSALVRTCRNYDATFLPKPTRDLVDTVRVLLAP